MSVIVPWCLAASVLIQLLIVFVLMAMHNQNVQVLDDIKQLLKDLKR
jgi:hypothetical protein